MHFNNYYTLRSLPQFQISVILARPESFFTSEGFPTSGNDTEKNNQFSDALRSLPQGSS